MRRHTLRELFGAGLACGLAHGALAAPRSLPTVHVPREATRANYVAPVPQDQHLRLAITLPMHNLPILEGLLQRLQDRRSPDYRHYLSVAEFTSRFGPTQAEYATLIRFAADHGLTVRATSPNRFVLDIEGSVAAIQDALHLRLGIYRHRNGGGLFYAPDREPALEIGTPVLHVAGLDNAQPPVGHGRHRPENRQTLQANGSGPNGDYTSSDMRAAYYGSTGLNGAGQTVGLIAFAGFDIADINRYFSSLGQNPKQNVIGISVDGTSLRCDPPGCDNFEQSIDIEQVIGMAPGLRQVFVYVGSTVIDILNRMATDDIAKSLSSSYGWGADEADEDPVYMEFAAQGQSFVDATGDDGADLPDGGVWPGDDAHVTAVGGTDLATAWAGGPWLSETAWSDSGGGPSPDGIRMTSWQRPFVNAANMAAKHRRNVPDVAAEANYDNYACYDGTCSGGNGGTSFAAPRWAGFLALANQQAAAAKLPLVGFADALIYPIAGGVLYATSFHDITQGNNGKYQAVVGYDDVTGFGSPQLGLITALVGP